MTLIDWVHGAVFRRRVRRLALHIGQLVGQGDRILDLGCGDGTIGRILREANPSLEVFGADPLIRAQVAIAAVGFDGKRLPLRDASVDGVLLVDVLHHTPSPHLLLAEADRVARKYIIIKDHVAQGRTSRSVLSVMDWVGNARHGVDLPYRYLSRDEWASMFHDLGLREVARKDRLGLYPWPLSWFFDAKLHFIARLTAGNRTP